MATKTDIKKLLSKGLTGWEAGLLVFEDSWRVSRDEEEGFLSDRDIEILKGSLKSQKDTQDYNTLIRLYRTADYIEKQCICGVFAASSSLERVAGLGYLQWAPFMARMALNELPLLVTEKELKSLKARQRRKLLKRLYCMDQVISWRAYALAPEEIRKDSEPECIETDAPELYQQAEQEIANLVEAGKLKPVKLDIQAWSESLLDDETRTVTGEVEYWPGDTEWTPEEAEGLIQTYVSGQDLYRAGLPEWKAWIDTFKMYELEKECWIGYDPPPYVAIVQEPEKYDLDRRGYFRKSFLDNWPMRPLGKDELRLADISSESAELVIDKMGGILARRQVLKELGQVIGLALEEGVDFGIDAILKPSLGRYNGFARDIPSELDRFIQGAKLTDEERDKALEQIGKLDKTPGSMMALHKDIRLKLPPVKLEKIRPSAKELAEVRSWISEILGDRWWEDAGETHRKPKSLLPERMLEKWPKLKGDGEKEAAGES